MKRTKDNISFWIEDFLSQEFLKDTEGKGGTIPEWREYRLKALIILREVIEELMKK